eukprot:2665288-Prymnesium_polylepis.1
MGDAARCAGPSGVLVDGLKTPIQEHQARSLRVISEQTSKGYRLPTEQQSPGKSVCAVRRYATYGLRLGSAGTTRHLRLSIYLLSLFVPAVLQRRL